MFDRYWQKQLFILSVITFDSSKMTMGQYRDLIVKIMIFVVHSFGDKLIYFCS